jgi:Domain of unknown function (DUF1707)
MDRRRDMRASDSDREAAAERLRAALNEGRLDVHEYDERLARAYRSVTYGELADLFVDVPVPAYDTGTGRGAAAQSVSRSLGSFSVWPRALAALWPVTLSIVVLLGLLVWILVGLAGGAEASFWPQLTGAEAPECPR